MDVFATPADFSLAQPAPFKRRPGVDRVPLKKGETRLEKREQLIHRANIVQQLLRRWEMRNDRLPRGIGKWARAQLHVKSRVSVRQLMLRCRAYQLCYRDPQAFVE